METVVHNIRDLNFNDRSAAEQLVGHALGENQQLVIQVINAPPEAAQSVSASSEIPDWWNIYEGLSDERIEELDRAIRQRANLTREFE